MPIRLPQDISVPPDLYFPQDFTFGAGRPSDRLRSRRLLTARRQPPYGAPRPTVGEPELGDLADQGAGTGTGATLRPVLGGARRVWPTPTPGEAPAAMPEELALTRQALSATKTLGGGVSKLFAGEPEQMPGGANLGLGDVADVVLPGSGGPFFEIPGGQVSPAGPGTGPMSETHPRGVEPPPFELSPSGEPQFPSVPATDFSSALSPSDIDLATAAEQGDVLSGTAGLGDLGDWLRVVGGAAGLAGVGAGLAQGGQAGDRTALHGLQSLVGSIIPGFGLVNTIGKAVEVLVNFGLGEGIFGKTPLPFGRGHNFSSAENRASQISKATGTALENPLKVAIEGATNPLQLLSLASQGPALSPHGEVQFWHPELGHGGDWQSPTDPRFAEALTKIAETGDADTLRKFLSGVVIQVGEGGATGKNYLLTDLFRRKLASLLPETHPVRQDVTGLFEETPEQYRPEPWGRSQADLLGQSRQTLLNAMEPTGDEFAQPFTGFGMPAFPTGADAAGGWLQTPLSPLFRAPEEYQLPDAVKQALLQQLGFPDPFPRYTQTGDYSYQRKAPVVGEPEPGSVEWYAKYVPL